MSKFGVLGSYLAKAAEESDSSVADMITHSKQTLEQERRNRPPQKRPVKAASHKRKKKRPAKPKQKDHSPKPTSSDSTASTQ